jgi:phosphotransferase system  glucose/maltose/N-acetylglucosamine-specific IIC component
MVITFGMMAILKLFFPKNVGLFIYNSGGVAFGVIGDPTNVRREILGYWIIPIGIVLSLLIYLFLTRLLRELKIAKKD